MPFLPMCTRGRAEVKQAALPTVTAQHEDAGKCDHSIRSSINKGTSERCLETRLLPPVSRYTNLAGTYCEYLAESRRQVDSVVSAKMQEELEPFP